MAAGAAAAAVFAGYLARLPYNRRLAEFFRNTVMLNEIKKDAQARMTKSIEALRHDLTKLRTGRATTALVDHI